MRWWPVLLFVPLAGCLHAPGSATLLLGWDAPPGSAAPVPVVDCAALLDDLKARTLEESAALLDQSVKGYHGPVMWMEGDVAFAAADGAPRSAATQTASASPPNAHGAEVTGTNNQEAGVDEADILKTDGKWTYAYSDGSLHILRSDYVGDLKRVARLEVGGWDGALLLQARTDGDRLLVITSHGRDEAPVAMDTWSVTRVRTYSLLDRAAPGLLDDRWLEGEHMGSRLIDGIAYVVVYTHPAELGLRTWAWPEDQDLAKRGLDWEDYSRLTPRTQESLRASIAAEAKRANAAKVAATDLDDHLPTVARRTAAGYVTTPVDDCAHNLIVPDATGRGTNTILSISLAGTGSAMTQVTGDRPIVYGSGDALVLASDSRAVWWLWRNPDIDETTDVQWFDLDGLTVTPRASGRLPGTVLDSFSIDEQDGRLRIATTTGQWMRFWDDAPEPMASHLVVMEEEAGLLVPKGIVSGIAPGERIWSARFTEDRAYLVTFRQIDPLWVIDLSQPTAPRILGELEIEGVSTYIHPLSDELLMTIGYGPGEGGRGLDWGHIQVSLFDISDPTAPRRADVTSLSPPDAWAHSIAVDEHKAFTYWAALGMLAVPLSSHEGDIGLQLVNVDEEAMTLELDAFLHQSALAPPEDERYWYGGVLRSYFYGAPGTPMVSLYAMSQLGITSHDLWTMNDQAAVPF